MFIGHFAVAFAAKRFAPRASLAALLFAAVFADLLWPVLVAAGIEEVRIAPGSTAYTPLEFVSYPWSHSLLMLLIWAVLFAVTYRGLSRSRTADSGEDIANGSTFGAARAGVVLGILVLSHWILDFITHRPDMPLYPGGPKLGLGLWNSVPATVIVEIVMFAAGVLVYLTSTRARDRIGRWGFWGLAALLLVSFAIDSMSADPPPSVRAIWISALVATAIILVWAEWVERHRETPARTVR